MRNTLRLIFFVASGFFMTDVLAQTGEGMVTSATDHEVRIEKVRRVKSDSRATERHGKSLKRRKSAGTKAVGKEARVYKRHRHFATRDIKLRSRSKTVRRESLGVGTE